MTKQFTSKLKLKAVNYYHKINKYVKVCEVFECSKTLFVILSYYII